MSLIKLATFKTEKQLSDEATAAIHNTISDRTATIDKYNKYMKILPYGIDVKVN